MRQLSQDVPIITAATIQVTAGQATYDLPADFLYEIELAGLPAQGGVIVGNSGLIPVGDGWEETHHRGDTLRLDPVPTYTTTRTLRYAAQYVPTNGVYPRLSENGARVAMLYGSTWRYSSRRTPWPATAGPTRLATNPSTSAARVRPFQAQAGAVLTNYQNAIRPLRAMADSTGRTLRRGVEV